jgi:hypothetical protein
LAARAQVCWVERARVTVRMGEVERKVTYALTSLMPDRVDTAPLRDH